MADILFSSWGGQIVDNRGKEPQNFDPVTIDLPEYFNQDDRIKALIGWDGIVLRSEEVDIIDLCREYFSAIHPHAAACDKCNYCKTGFAELIEVLEDIINGEATEDDLEFLQSAAEAVVDSSKCSIGRRGPGPLFNTLTHFADDYTKALSGDKPVKTGKYYSKLTAPCMDACPIHLDVPRYIEMIKEAKFADSLEVIRERLPLPGVVGRVCFRPCESRCRRKNVDEAIAIKALKRFVADQELSEEKEPEFPVNPSDNTGKVAIVGAGPAGITCGYHLASRGHAITIFEHLSEPGGMSAVGIPDYRLPRPILREEVERIQKMGVTINYNQTVGKEVMLSQLESEYDAVFVAIGAQDSMSMGIEGEDQSFSGFMQGLEYLREINDGNKPCPESSKVAVIGGGNVAIDCVRSSFRIGKQEVHLVYRRTRDEMPADYAEIQDAEEENVNFHFLTAPIRILADDGKVVGLECLKMTLGETDESGRPRPVPVEGSEFVFDCDMVVAAIGQRVDLSLLEGVDKIQTTRWNTVVVNEYTKQSDRPKLFFAGDCETGPDALITACAGGRKAAYNIDRFINNLPLEYDNNYYFDKLFESVDVYNPEEEIKRVESRPRLKQEILAAEPRKSKFDEVEQGFSAQEAVAEAERCLRCYQVATIAI